MALYHIVWTKGFTEREVKEIDFSRIYADSFGHGTDGHNAKMVIAKMSDMLNLVHNTLTNPAMSDKEKIAKLNGIIRPRE